MGHQASEARPGQAEDGHGAEGANRQAACERRKKDRAMTMAAMLHLLARDDDAIRRRMGLV